MHWSRSSRRTRMVLVCVTFFGALGIRTSTSASPIYASFGVASLVCDHDPGPYGGRDERLPLGCHWQPGVKMTILTNTGENYASCFTGPDGWCHIAVKGFRLLLLEDIGDLPTGLTPVLNPKPIFVSSNGSWIVNIPTASVPEPAANGAILTIHSRICPAGYAGNDYYHACDPNAPRFHQRFSLFGPTRTAADVKGAWADQNGNAVFEQLPAGDYLIEQGLPDDIARLWTYCSYNWNPDTPLPIATAPMLGDDPVSGIQSRLTLHAGDNVLCDFYAVPTA